MTSKKKTADSVEEEIVADDQEQDPAVVAAALAALEEIEKERVGFEDESPEDDESFGGSEDSGSDSEPF